MNIMEDTLGRKVKKLVEKFEASTQTNLYKFEIYGDSDSDITTKDKTLMYPSP